MYILDMYSGPVALHYEIKLCYVMLCYVMENGVVNFSQLPLIGSFSFLQIWMTFIIP